jgi:hypothetical protein
VQIPGVAIKSAREKIVLTQLASMRLLPSQRMRQRVDALPMWVSPMVVLELSARNEWEEEEEDESQTNWQHLQGLLRFVGLLPSRHCQAPLLEVSMWLAATSGEEPQQQFGRQPTATQICEWPSKFSTRVLAISARRIEK